MRQRTPSGNEDATFKRCKRCGFPCNTDRDKTGPGSGLIYVAVTHTATACPDNPTVISGCPFCGSRNYENWQK
jgi:hypothetical protein